MKIIIASITDYFEYNIEVNDHINIINPEETDPVMKLIRSDDNELILIINPTKYFKEMMGEHSGKN